MSIKELVEKIKSKGEAWRPVLSLVLMGTLGFGLGRLSKVESLREPIRIESSPAAVNMIDQKIETVSNQATGNFVASKNGTKYHAPWCPGAKQIAAANKIYFKTKAEAEAAGYTKAANCQGL